MGTEEITRRADAIADGLTDEASVDLRSFVATYVAKRDEGDERAAASWARAVVNRAGQDGYDYDSAPVATRDELRAEIKARNEGRDEADRIKPVSQKRDDLAAALAADDAQS